MRHFFTKNTVEAVIWCVPCHKETLWKVAGGRPQYCTECYDKRQTEEKSAEPSAVQQDLFGDIK